MSKVAFPYHSHPLLERASSIRVAQYAYCEHCGRWLGSPYWALAKSVALHKGGTGHDVTLHRLAE